MGYGYGVWLVLRDFSVFTMINKHNIKNHTSHITVMCNMDRASAISLARELHGVYNVTISNRYRWFCSNDDKYSKSNNQQVASGFNCIIPEWKKIMKITEKYEGDVPKIPHVSIVYRYSEAALPTHIETSPLKTSGIIFAVDITDDEPNKWTLIDKT